MRLGSLRSAKSTPCPVILNVKRGLLVEAVNPKRTSIDCFRCGAEVRKTLSQRIHHCSHCGVSIDRDWNSGLNILNRGLLAVGLPLNGCGKSIPDIEEQQVSFVSLGSPRYTVRLA